jgi:Flp pilus assembly pilin Flp
MQAGFLCSEGDVMVWFVARIVLGIQLVLSRVLPCTRGVTSVEYSLIAAGLSAVIVAVVFLFGDELAVTIGLLTETFEGAGDRMSTE